MPQPWCPQFRFVVELESTCVIGTATARHHGATTTLTTHELRAMRRTQRQFDGVTPGVVVLAPRKKYPSDSPLFGPDLPANDSRSLPPFDGLLPCCDVSRCAWRPDPAALAHCNCTSLQLWPLLDEAKYLTQDAVACTPSASSKYAHGPLKCGHCAICTRTQ
jgi:hypothetical protein